MSSNDSGLSPERIAHYEALAARAAADDYEPGPAPEPDGADETAEEFVARWLPPELVESARARSRGRPSMSGEGPSPARMIRLPASLDAELAARAAAEGRPMSALVREAVATYLTTPSAA